MGKLTGVAVVALVLALCSSMAFASCWNDYQFQSGAGYTTAFYVNAKYDGASTYHVHNYTLQSFNNDKYAAKRGERIYQTTLFDANYYTYSSVSYSGNFPNSAVTSRNSAYTCYFPMFQLSCDNTSAACQILVNLCIDVYNSKTGELLTDSVKLMVEEFVPKDRFD